MCEYVDFYDEFKNITLFKTYKYDNTFKVVYYIKKNINLSDITLQKDEVEKVEYLSKEKNKDLIKNNNFRKTNLDALYDFYKER